MNRDVETAQYAADMILELRNLAKAEKLVTLQGLLEICYYEAYAAAHKIEVPLGEERRLEDMGAYARQNMMAS
jgi:hypothetical protein